MGSQDRPITAAVKNKDYKKLESVLKQGINKDQDKEIYNCLFEICNEQNFDSKALIIFLDNPTIDINYHNGNGEAILHILSRNGHIKGVQLIIKLQNYRSVRIDAKCHKRKTPLLMAAEHGNLDILKLLENHGADITYRDSVENGAIHLAATKGHLECVKYLIEEKLVDVNIKNKYNDTPLLKAANDGRHNIIEYLLQHGSNIHDVDIDGQSALLKSAFVGSLKCLEILLQHGSDVNLQDNYGFSPFMYAASKGNLKCMKMLKNARPCINVDMENNRRRTALNYAARSENTDVLTYLLIDLKANVDIQDVVGRTALIWAASMGHTDIVRLLLNSKANVRTQDIKGKTALSWAAENGHTDVVIGLLNAEADVDVQDVDGGTAFTWAARNGHVNCIKQLVESGAYIDVTDNLGETALMKAARYDCKEVVTFLLEIGAKRNLKNRRNKTAFDLAYKYEIKQLLR